MTRVAPNARRPPYTCLLRPLALIVALGSGGASLVAHAAPDEDAEEAVDYVALAARLFRDGHVDRAKSALAQVDEKDPQLDVQRYSTLRGLIALQARDFKAARPAFERAIEAQQRADAAEAAQRAKEGEKPVAVRADPSLLMYLAQACYGSKDYKKTIEVLTRAGAALDAEPNAFLMRADAHRQLGQSSQAFSVFAEGEKRFPKQAEFVRLPLFYLIELGLFQRGMELGERYLSRDDANADDYVAVGESLRKGKELEKASLVLEGAHLRFPADDRVLLALAHVYLDQQRPFVAATLLEQAAQLDPKYAVEAAELYKRARRFERALWLNGRVSDQPAKHRQRLGILLDLERYELVAAMEPTLSRLGLLAEDDVRYALAYGFFKIGEHEQAQRQLNVIVKPELESSVNQLRKAMEACRQQGWECL
jgi:tetratricopeptide (TPR) repeat protein